MSAAFTYIAAEGWGAVYFRWYGHKDAELRDDECWAVETSPLVAWACGYDDDENEHYSEPVVIPGREHIARDEFFRSALVSPEGQIWDKEGQPLGQGGAALVDVYAEWVLRCIAEAEVHFSLPVNKPPKGKS